MMGKNYSSVRADPDVLLSAITKKSGRKKGGKLSLFIGMAPGVGKTYTMLLAAKEAKKRGLNVVIGVVESHGRKETEALIDGLEVIPKNKLLHRDIEFTEMDIDAILAYKPNIVIVDELAHTNIPGSRHQKRWQDVIELLDAGIDVYSTLNIQHLESRKESVEKIAKISIPETVPDSVLDRAFEIQLIDLPVPHLLQRLKEGKVYLGDKAELAAAYFFKEETLTALREMALRVAAERVDTELNTFAPERELGTSWGAVDRLMVAVGTSENAETVIRTTRKIAYNLNASWIAIHILNDDLTSDDEKAILKKNLDLARSLGAEIVIIADINVVDALIRVAQQKDVSQIIVGRSNEKFFRDKFGHGSIHDQLIKRCTIDICVLGPKSHSIAVIFAKISSIKINSTIASFFKAFIYTCAMMIFGMIITPFVGYRTIGFLLLLGILFLGLFLPIGSILFASIITMFGWNFFFIPPVGSFYINESEDIYLSLSFLVAALSTGVLTRRIKYQQQILLNRELRTQALNQILLDLASANTKQLLCAAVIKRIATIFRGECDIILVKNDKSLSTFVGGIQFDDIKREMAVAKWAIDNNKAAGQFTETLASSQALYIPMSGSFEIMGAMAYRAKSLISLSIEDMDFLFTIAHQLAISLEKQQFRKKALGSDHLAESGKMQRKFLELLANEIRLSPDSNNPSLILTMDNLLWASRLLAGAFPLKRESCELKEIIESAISRAQIVFADRSLTINIHGDGDGRMTKLNIERNLIIQGLANILLNIAQEAREKTISIELSLGKIILSAMSQLPEEEDLKRIFEKFHRSKESLQGYYNIGFSIAKGIIKAHGGKISSSILPSGKLLITVNLARSAKV